MTLVPEERPRDPIVDGPAGERSGPGTTGLVAAAAVFGVPAILVALAVVLNWDPVITLDRSVAVFLHGYAVDHPAVARVTQVWTDVFGPWTWRVSVVVVAVWTFLHRRRLVAVWALAALVLGGAVDGGVKLLLGRTRPVWTDPVSQASGPSFPSGHALTSALGGAILVLLVWPALCQGLRRTICPVVATAVFLTGFSRLLLGVHYLSDVVAGWLFALSLVSATCLWMARPGHPGRCEGPPRPAR
ncbi:phosphatase PAP2 family protein [Amycolatopsis sp. H20-H5]|uniref:phosphatase PAP2 family protein n=1 Tax=Amycolatopsis sp. H20-H5 TaxID=3046309 RepID=UPI002DB77A26|nr:phosphatase PAP2 family protein [Amycolatopsis sp. H20-H5]MEC3981994.1 phosphatase PAP2 family protein [Amycolatopsis sp. H20-H5]